MEFLWRSRCLLLCECTKLLLNVHKEIFILLWQRDRLIAPRALTVYKAHRDKFMLDQQCQPGCTRVRLAQRADIKVLQFSAQKEFSLTIDCAFDWLAFQFSINYLFKCSSPWCYDFNCSSIVMVISAFGLSIYKS